MPWKTLGRNWQADGATFTAQIAQASSGEVCLNLI